MKKQVIIGRGNPSGQNVAIGVNARARSTYVIGITGTGKSTLLESMAYQDMANRDGLCFLDPHGDSVKKLLATVPDYRESEVIFWDPSAIDRPFGFNPFYCSDPTNELEVSRKAQSFIDALGSLKEFASIFESAPRMKNMLQQLATTFIINQGHTLAETPKFLLDQEYREQFYPALSNRFARIRRYWEEELDSRSEHERREISESSLNKLERFQSDPVLYSIFGQPSNSIDFRKAMDTGPIILINLGADKGGLIGAFVVWELLQAAFSRADTPEQERRPFHLFADEFQTYMTTAFPMLQAQARKYGVDTVIAHQVRAQLTPEIAEITPAVGNLIIFRVTSHNAEALASEFNTTPPPPEPVPQMITEPVYKYSTEVIWTPKEAEAEHQRLMREQARLGAEAILLSLSVGVLRHWSVPGFSGGIDVLKSLKALIWMVEDGIKEPAADSLIPLYQRFNPSHYDERVKEYLQKTFRMPSDQPNRLGIRPSRRRSHAFPATLPSAAEYYLEQFINGKSDTRFSGWSTPASHLPKEEAPAIAAALLAELRTVLLPLKQKAGPYWFDLDYKPWESSANSSYRQQGSEQWEVKPFPEMLPWLQTKATKLLNQIETLEKKINDLWTTCRKEEQKKQYLYDKPVRAPAPSSRSPEQEIGTYRWVPGTPRQRSDVAAEIANQLTGLANFQARVKLTQENARPTEHLVSTFDYPGIENEELARELRERSRDQFGRDRGEVERAIEERLQVNRKTSDDGGEPILREKSQSKNNTTSERKRPSKPSADDETV